jgi:hypothetical protein
MRLALRFVWDVGTSFLGALLANLVILAAGLGGIYYLYQALTSGGVQ